MDLVRNNRLPLLQQAAVTLLIQSPGIMIRSARSRDWTFCLALVQDRESGAINGIVNGLQHHEIEILISCLRQSRQVIETPMLLPLLLFEQRIHFFARLLEKRAKAVEHIEELTGMTHGFREELTLIPSGNSIERWDGKLRGINFGPIIQKLTGIAGTLAFCEMTFESHLKVLDLVRPWFAKVSKETKHDSAEQPPWQGCQDVERRIGYLRSLISGAKAHSKVLDARRAAQVQTVCWPALPESLLHG